MEWRDAPVTTKRLHARTAIRRKQIAVLRQLLGRPKPASDNEPRAAPQMRSTKKCLPDQYLATNVPPRLKHAFISPIQELTPIAHDALT